MENHILYYLLKKIVLEFIKNYLFFWGEILLKLIFLENLLDKII